MAISLGVSVVSTDGHHLGAVEGFEFDSSGRTAVLATVGGALHHRFEALLDLLEADASGLVILSMTAEEAGTLPDSDQSEDAKSRRIGEGSPVVSLDGEKVGSLHSLSVNEADGSVASVAITRGILFSEEVDLPGTAFGSVADGAVTLNMARDTVAEYASTQTVLLF